MVVGEGGGYPSRFFVTFKLNFLHPDTGGKYVFLMFLGIASAHAH